MTSNQGNNTQATSNDMNSIEMSSYIACRIRNFLLSKVTSEKQGKLVEKYRDKVEQKLSLDNLVIFFEQYLNIKVSAKSISRKNMCQEFESLFEGATTEEIISELSGYADAYQYLVDKKKMLILDDEKVCIRFHKIRDELIDLQNNIVNMFLMPKIIDFSKGCISENNLLLSFEITLSYVFRRIVTGKTTSGMPNMFKILHQVTKNSQEMEYGKDLYHAIIASQTKMSNMFPSDDEFYEKLLERNLYGGKFTKTQYLLYKLEEYNPCSKLEDKTEITIEHVMPQTQMQFCKCVGYKNTQKKSGDEKKITIEHVMPQTLTGCWKCMLGEDHNLLHKKNVHKLGNLTLTSHNDELSNNVFKIKKEIFEKHNENLLNQYFQGIETWDIESIKMRGEKLAKLALEIWKYPENI